MLYLHIRAPSRTVSACRQPRSGGSMVAVGCNLSLASATCPGWLAAAAPRAPLALLGRQVSLSRQAGAGRCQLAACRRPACSPPPRETPWRHAPAHPGIPLAHMYSSNAPRLIRACHNRCSILAHCSRMAMPPTETARLMQAGCDDPASSNGCTGHTCMAGGRAPAPCPPASRRSIGARPTARQRCDAPSPFNYGVRTT